MPGHPDWQAYAQWRSDNMFEYLVTTLAAGKEYSTGYQTVQHWSSLLVRCKPSSGYGNVEVRWYTGANGTGFISDDLWDVSADTALYVVIPVQSAYVSVTVTNSSTVSMDTYAYATGANNAASVLYYPVTHNQVSAVGVTLAASASATYQLGFAQSVPAQLAFNPHDTTGSLEPVVYTVGGDGTKLYNVWYAGKPTAPVNEMIILPDDPVVLYVGNTDAAASHTFDAALIPQSAG